jgi:hypothetical protein
VTQVRVLNVRFADIAGTHHRTSPGTSNPPAILRSHTSCNYQTSKCSPARLVDIIKHQGACPHFLPEPSASHVLAPFSRRLLHALIIS